jgi:hypothetical protein
MEKKDYRYEALALASIGISVIPVKDDGSKLPKIKWKEFQERIMTEEEIDLHFESCGGVIAITGEISKLLCIDFDLDKQRDSDDFWGSFMSQVPVHMKEKMLVNQTRSGGFHIWLKTDYEDKSRKIAHRPLTIPELNDRYNILIDNGANEDTATTILLKKPLECVIETRSKGSYGVFVHHQYKRFYNKSLSWFTKEEIEFLLNIAYSLDYTYKPKRVFEGNVNSYRIIAKFNKDTKASGVVRMLEESGMFTVFDIDTNGNYRLSRVGSSSLFSAYVYGDTGNLKIFGLNPLTNDEKSVLQPFEVYCAVNELTTDEAIEKLK